MSAAKKITVEVSEELLEKAQSETGEGITETVKRGLELLARANAYKHLRELRGKVKFSKTWEELKDDRE